jgi:hypothetical protein
MKLNVALAMLFTGPFLFFSCVNEEDESYNSSGDSTVRIKTQTSVSNDNLGYYQTFDYDNDGYLIQYQYFWQDGPLKVQHISYINNKVITNEYEMGDDKPYVQTYYINSRGLADSSLYTYDYDTLYICHFEYDRAGFAVKREYDSKKYGIYFSEQYDIKDGNIDRSIFFEKYDIQNLPDMPSRISDIRFSKTCNDLNKFPDIRKSLILAREKGVNTIRSFSDTVYYKYYDIPNTIGDVNRGAVWMGRQNKNLISKDIYLDNGKNEITQYKYIFDYKGRVTKQYNPEDERDYVTFTYVE